MGLLWPYSSLSCPYLASSHYNSKYFFIHSTSNFSNNSNISIISDMAKRIKIRDTKFDLDIFIDIDQGLPKEAEQILRLPGNSIQFQQIIKADSILTDDEFIQTIKHKWAFLIGQLVLILIALGLLSEKI